jgi:predicted transposase YbfD/YdcC
MDCTVFSQPFSSWTAQQREQLRTECALLSLAHAFASLPDPRSRHGWRDDRSFVLICLIAALLCTCDHREAVAQWGRGHRALLGRLFGKRRFLCPTGVLYRWLLPRISIAALETLLSRRVNATLDPPGHAPIALDGTVVRGAKMGEETAPHVLSFRSHDEQEPLVQIRVEDNTNEIPVAQAMLPLIVQPGCVSTADALHTQLTGMHVVHDCQAFPGLTVKDHQPTLLQDLQTSLADPHARCHPGRNLGSPPQASRTSLHSCQLRDVCFRADDVAPHSPCGPTNACHHEEKRHNDRNRLPAIVRGHWSMENGSHSVRDVTCGEDRSHLRSGDAPQILATVRNLAIPLIHRTGTSQIAAPHRTFSHDPAQALDLLFRCWGTQQSFSDPAGGTKHINDCREHVPGRRRARAL